MDLTITRSSVERRDDPDAVVEYFWSRPVLGGPAPCMVLVHGHNPTLRYGARTEFLTGLHEFFADNGFVTASVSQPGYGGSTGPPDYCGPASWAAVRSVIDRIVRVEGADPERITVYGLSRGATVGLMAATTDARISAVVAVAGLYDFVGSLDHFNAGIRGSLSTETRGSTQELRLRSPLEHVEQIDAPVLILHGARDDVAPFAPARRTYERAQRLGKDFEFEPFEEYGHGIPFSLCGERTLDFLRRRGLGQEGPSEPYRLSFQPS